MTGQKICFWHPVYGDSCIWVDEITSMHIMPDNQTGILSYAFWGTEPLQFNLLDQTEKQHFLFIWQEFIKNSLNESV
jgi:hypothetical protein